MTGFCLVENTVFLHSILLLDWIPPYILPGLSFVPISFLSSPRETEYKISDEIVLGQSFLILQKLFLWF
jgi:hypothetical protein